MDKRLTPYLRRRVLDLSMSDRVALMEDLRVSIQGPFVNRADRLKYLADTMNTISGVDIRGRWNRTSATVWPRNIFIFVALREGYSQSEVGREIHRNHSTVCHARNRVNEAFEMPEQYRDEITLYKKYIETL